mgnify:FL=1
MRTNGLSEIALTKLDILSGFEELPICHSYKVGDKIIKEMPASLSDFRKSKPVYETLEGWGDITSDMIKEGFDALPLTLRNYVKYIEGQIDCKITIISVGPQRHETIIR